MTDMLVKLFDLPDDWTAVADQARKGVTIRKPLGLEKHLLERWVETHFMDGWSSEVDRACSNRPETCFIAIEQGEIAGFACYDATALGFFGPTGVLESRRGRGIGRALLLACMLDMKLAGYGYAIIGAVGPADFYRRTVGAVEIPDSTPGIWKTALWKDRDDEKRER